ncbi:MAG: acyltransferase [Gammaproteobacteria bacterium]|nr:acyltransferase [Gammaproteobacteria bacterium]
MLSVVAFHAFPGRLPGGFIGVDIFFVISGFLISTILFENLERGTFSFADFYSRRIRRIFPALSLVLVATLTLGWVLLFNEEFRQVSKHVSAGAAFIANLALWQESSYFDSDAAHKPLLHLWSLGVEEQFYLVWPLLVYWGWRLRTNLLLLTALIAVASFALNIASRHADPVGMFYSPLTRFWELLAGAALAYLAGRRPGLTGLAGIWRHAASALAALLVLGGCVFLSESDVFPGWWALIPIVSATLFIAAGPDAVVNRWILGHPVMVWFGLISYPLYLWHWPFLSYASLTLGSPSPLVKIALVLVAIALAYATYRFAERPIRRSHSTAKIAGLATAMTAACIVGLVVHATGAIGTRAGAIPATLAPPDEQRITDATLRDGHTCAARLGLPLLPSQNCIATSDRPSVLFMGDSHATAIFAPLFQSRPSIPGLLIGSNGCDLYPNLTYTSLNASPYGRNCQSIAREALRVAASLPTIDTVVIAHAVPQIRQQNEPKAYSEGDRSLDYYQAIVVGTGALLDELARAGKRVFVLKDVPYFRYEPENCARDLQFMSARVCQLERAAFDSARAPYEAAMAELSKRHPAVHFVDPTPLFCGRDYCSARDEHHYLYSDREHLSVYGATRLLDAYLHAALTAGR